MKWDVAVLGIQPEQNKICANPSPAVCCAVDEIRLVINELFSCVCTANEISYNAHGHNNSSAGWDE